MLVPFSNTFHVILYLTVSLIVNFCLENTINVLRKHLKKKKEILMMGIIQGKLMIGIIEEFFVVFN